MTAYLPGPPDLDGQPGPCYCGHGADYHHGGNPLGYCLWCDDCGQYAEHAAVQATHAALDHDDQLDGERSRTRDNLTAAIHLEQRRARRTA